MGYKGRHRAPAPLAKKLRIPAITVALVTTAMGLFQGQTVPEDPPVPPVEVTMPTLPVTPTPTPTATPTPTPTAPTPTPAPTTSAKKKPKQSSRFTFPTSGPSYGGVKPHVRKVGWLVQEMFGIKTVGGVRRRAIDRSGHPAGLALDFMCSRKTGDAIASFLLANKKTFGIKYVIWRQRINFGSGWKMMEDRGSVTANHYDHVHVSFY